MNEFESFSDTLSIDYGSGRPALLFGAHGAACSDVAAMMGDAGIRLAAQVPLADARARLDQQLSLGLAWVEAGAGDPVPASLFDRLDHLAQAGTPVVVSIAADQIDEAAAILTAPSVQLLVDAAPIDRAAALATALAHRDEGARVNDVGRDNAVRLRQISDEMGRIAATLARLSSGPEAVATQPMAARPAERETPALDVETVRGVIRARRLRARFFDEAMFADPAWDMLLDLLQAEIAQHRVPVSSLCIAAAVPATTALRWIKTMTDAGLFVRRADPHDGRRVFVELAPDASRAMRQYFGEVARPVAA